MTETPARTGRVRPIFVRLLWLTLTATLCFVGAVQVFGGAMGASCVDSYGCKGFLVGGAECLETDEERYCTVYCEGHDECPVGWRCLDAHPTVLTVETTLLDGVCTK